MNAKSRAYRRKEAVVRQSVVGPMGLSSPGLKREELLAEMKPDRLFAIWLNGAKLTEPEAEKVSRYMDENSIGTRRPVAGVSIKEGEKQRKAQLRAEKAERKAARAAKPKAKKRRKRKPTPRQPAA